jgi:DNA-binding NtrC family response regulator
VEEESKYKYNQIKEEIGLFGSTPEIERLIRVITTVAPTDLSVLIIGESGTGKELVARAIHRLSDRAQKSLIAVNTGAIPEGILESELFGHEKGSFTGAVGQKKGYFEAANHGTIFLDEIGEMPLNTQVKLLRVIEESEFMRVGGTETHKVDVRLIAATNKNLENAVKNNEFRQDLYFRLKAITIEILPLRRRREDIPILAKKFASDYAAVQNIRFKGFSPGEVVNSSYVASNLSLYHEDGTKKNLPVPLKIPHDQAEREIIYRTLLALKLEITEIKQILVNMNSDSFNRATYELPTHSVDSMAVDDKNELKPTTLSGMERELIKQTLNKFSGSRRKTARALQISERTLYRKIKEYGL